MYKIDECCNRRARAEKSISPVLISPTNTKCY